MKKIFILSAIVILIACNISNNPKHFSFNTYFKSGVIYTYTNIPINETSIYLAGAFMNTNTNGANPDNIVGESIYFENLEVADAIIKLKAKVQFTEYLEQEQVTIIYAYSKLIPSHKIVNNKKINLQIATAKNYSVIGWPLIYGSF